MTLVDGLPPPPPLPIQAMLVVRKTTETKKFTVSQPKLLCRGNGEQNNVLIRMVS